MKYIAIIGDIKSSKTVENRGVIQKQLKQTLENVNSMFASDIAAKFLITLGDEFQGLLAKSDNLLEIIHYIKHEMYPVTFRFGIGIGEITTEIDSEAAIGADGPAFYSARKMINEIHEEERKLKEQAADIKVEISGKETLETEEINTLLLFLKNLEDDWYEEQRRTIIETIKSGGNQKAIAKRMNTSQPTIARRLSEGKFATYEQTKKVIKSAICGLGVNA